MALERLGGLRVVDLFAGSGALGIEALSRGAAFADFVESSRAARAALERESGGARVCATRSKVWPLHAAARLAPLGAVIERAGSGPAGSALRRRRRAGDAGGAGSAWPLEPECAWCWSITRGPKCRSDAAALVRVRERQYGETVCPPITERGPAIVRGPSRRAPDEPGALRAVSRARSIRSPTATWTWRAAPRGCSTAWSSRSRTIPPRARCSRSRSASR